MEPVNIKLGSVEYNLTLPTSAIRDFEQRTGKGIFEVDLGVNFSHTVTLLYCTAKPLAKNPNLSVERIFELVQPADLKRVAAALATVLKRGFGIADEEEGEQGAEKKDRPLDSSISSVG